MSFANPGLLALLALVAAPILIHILFRLRPKRVRWPAMEFLRIGRKTTRRRVRLEQFLLLAARCLAIALVALLVARPRFGDSLASWLEGGPRSEQALVLDDTASMGETLGGRAAFAHATAAAGRLAERLGTEPGRHLFTALRTAEPGAPLLQAAVLDAEKATAFAADLARRTPTFRAASPAAALEAAASRLLDSPAAARALHVVGDFRRRDWADAAVASALRKLAGTNVKIRLVDAEAGGGAAGNLGVVKLAAPVHALAAGVPFQAEFAVRNFGTRDAENVAVTARLGGKPLPAKLLPRVPAGAVATAKLDLEATAAGPLELAVELPGDALAADNRRWLAGTVRPALPILLVDGDPQRSDGALLALALAPGSALRTGWAPTVRGVEALDGGSFERFRAVWLLDVPEVKEAAAGALKTFVEAGGGVALFAGPRTLPARWNATLAATGLAPGKLAAVRSMPAPEGNAAGWRVAAHPIFNAFAGDRAPTLAAVRIAQHWTLDGGAGTAQELAATTDGKPLAFEHAVGSGRVATFLYGAGPAWHDWPRQPSFVVGMLELAGRLAEPAVLPAEPVLGAAWKVERPATDFRPNPAWLPPGGERQELASVPAGANHAAATPALEQPGVHRVEWTTRDGAADALSLAVNLDPAEGDLARVGPDELRTLLAGIDHEFVAADAELADDGSQGFEPRDALAGGLLALLLFELWWSRRVARS